MADLLHYGEVSATIDIFPSLDLGGLDKKMTQIFDDNKTVNAIATELGFKYPQHFTRLFKQQVGYTPNEYRTLN